MPSGSTPRSFVVLAVAMTLTACATAPVPGAEAASDSLSVDLTLFGTAADPDPDIRLSLNQEAYVVVFRITEMGRVALLRPDGSASRHYPAGGHLFPPRIYRRQWQGVHGIGDIRGTRDDPDVGYRSYYLAVATPEPVDLHSLLDPSRPTSARVRVESVDEIANYLVAQIVPDTTSSGWDATPLEPWVWVRR